MTARTARWCCFSNRLGHPAGDETFRGVADVLLKQSRALDVVLSAYSFRHGWQITATFGIASLAEDVASPDELIRAANETLDAVKQAGENRVAVYHELAVYAAAHEVRVA